MKHNTFAGLGLAFLLAFLMLFSGCSGKPAADGGKALPKPVVAEPLRAQTRNAFLDYIGVVSTEGTSNISFQTGGKLKLIHVKKGDPVTTGMELAALDETNLQLAVDAATAQLAAAQAQYRKAVNGAVSEDVRNAELNVQKAQDARDYTADLLQKTIKLETSGAAAPAEVDKLRLELDLRESELSQSREVLSQVRSGARSEDVKALAAQVGQAEANLSLQTHMLENAVLVADMEGTVLAVPASVGEIVPAGYPVVVVGTDVRTIKTGVTASDQQVVRIGSRAEIGDASIGAHVMRVSDVPDPVTLTYEVELALDEPKEAEASGLVAGSVSSVRFLTGKVSGVWVPITTILADGEPHVFLAVNGHAVRRPVTLLETTGMDVRIEGLADGELLVTEGARRLTDGDPIVITERGETP